MTNEHFIETYKCVSQRDRTVFVIVLGYLCSRISEDVRADETSGKEHNQSGPQSNIQKIVLIIHCLLIYFKTWF